MTNAKHLLALSDEELGAEAAKILTPGPWKHEWSLGSLDPHCKKCKLCAELVSTPKQCTVPTPIDVTDWNVAMEWQRKYRPGYSTFKDIYMVVQKSAEPMHLYVIWKWIANMCEKKEARIRVVAAMLAEEKT